MVASFVHELDEALYLAPCLLIGQCHPGRHKTVIMHYQGLCDRLCVHRRLYDRLALSSVRPAGRSVAVKALRIATEERKGVMDC